MWIPRRHMVTLQSELDGLREKVRQLERRLEIQDEIFDSLLGELDMEIRTEPPKHKTRSVRRRAT